MTSTCSSVRSRSSGAECVLQAPRPLSLSPRDQDSAQRIRFKLSPNMQCLAHFMSGEYVAHACQ